MATMTDWIARNGLRLLWIDFWAMATVFAVVLVAVIIL